MSGARGGARGGAQRGESNVRLGIEALIERADEFRGLTCGVLTNRSTIMRDGRTVPEALIRAGFRVVRLFGPEHGFVAQAQDTVSVDDSRLQGIEVVSLYGTRFRPDKSHLSDLDAVIIDIQDIGCRYYTYLYTAAAVIEECSAAGVHTFVCDRPNPIGAARVEGGPLPHGGESEVGGYGLAIRHGLTIGEYARYLDGDFARTYAQYHQPKRSKTPAPWITEPTVFWMENYTRDTTYRDTGLPWKQPSPNLPTPETALVYPGTCLFEGTNISEGRGTTRPFEIIGAPWLVAEALRDELDQRNLPGAIFSIIDFVPTFSTFAGEPCRGVQLHVTDPRVFDAVHTGVEMLLAVHRQDPTRFAWRPLWEDARRSFIDHLTGGDEFRNAVDNGASPAEAYRILDRDAPVYADARDTVLYYRGAPD